jgi:Coenzyme PQQ synthesis protein D (PqqD)
MAARQVEGLLIERPAGELLVLKGSTNEAHALNETAAIVFDLCDGTTSRATMVAEVARRTGLPADESIVELALTELADAGLITGDESGRPELTRRALIRKLALPVAGIALLPVVETILMPTVASGQSTPPPLTPPPLTPPSLPTSSGQSIQLPRRVR